MIKKIFGLVVALGGLFLAKSVFATATTILDWSATNTSDMMAWIGQVWTDFSVPIVICLGVALGLTIAGKVISLVKRSVR